MLKRDHCVFICDRVTQKMLMNFDKIFGGV